MSSSRRSPLPRARRAKKTGRSTKTVGEIIDRIRAISALGDDTAYREQIAALAVEFEVSDMSLIELGSLAALTHRIASDLAAAWHGDASAVQRLRLRSASKAIAGNDAVADAYSSLAINGEWLPESQRSAVQAARAARTPRDMQREQAVVRLGLELFRSVCRTVFLGAPDALARLRLAWHELTRERPIGERRKIVVAAVRARADRDTAIELLLDADDAFFRVDEEQLRAILGRESGRGGDHAMCAELSLLAGAFDDHCEAGEAASKARARIAQRYRMAARPETKSK